MATHDLERTERSVELAFEVRDRRLFFVRASAEASCRVTLAEMVHRSDGDLLEFFTIEGASPGAVLDAAAEATAIEDARLIRENEGESLFEFVVSGPCIGGTLADVEAIVRDVVAEDGVGRVVADVPPHADARRVVETVRARHDAELVVQRERDRSAPEFTAREFRATLADRLTDRQLETLRTAWAAGYFAWPRESTGEDCADALGIAQPTFTEHLRIGQAKVVEALFDQRGTNGVDASDEADGADSGLSRGETAGLDR